MKQLEYMAKVENIYFSVNLIENWNDYFEKNLLEKMEKLKLSTHQSEVFLLDEIEIIGGIKRYAYGFRVTEKFRIYFANKVGDNYPIYVIVDAQYLHLNNIYYVLAETQEYILKILKYFVKDFKFDFYNVKLSRIDICNHTTNINLDKYIKPNEFNKRTVTRVRKVFTVTELIGEEEQKVPYFRFGSGSLAIRFYNKTKEIVEQQYKSFFFLLWLNEGLIDQKQKEIFELCYKLNNTYELDFLYAHLIYNKSILIEEDFEYIEMIYKSLELDNDDKYDTFKALIKKYKIKLVKEVVNVEFQIRSDYLRSLKILDKRDNTYIDFNNIYDLFASINELYKYLTTESFRVVDMNSNAKRKRDKKVDPIWEQIQNSKILNIDNFELDNDIYRHYKTEMDKVRSVRTTTKNLAHLFYLNATELETTDLNDIELIDLLMNLWEEHQANENLFNIRDMLKKQIKYYGEKKKVNADQDTNSK